MHSAAFEMGQIFAISNTFEKALTFFSLAIEMALSIVPLVKAETVAEYYMHRCQLYEALGMRD